jgi:predicted flap endonuclease-1-like 5' DNA nuclease
MDIEPSTDQDRNRERRGNFKNTAGSDQHSWLHLGENEQVVWSGRQSRIPLLPSSLIFGIVLIAICGVFVLGGPMVFLPISDMTLTELNILGGVTVTISLLSTGLVGRAKAAVENLGSSKPDEREPELTDIAPIRAERAAILTEAGFETPLDVWQADQRELSRLDKFDPTLADAVQRYAADLVDRESIPVDTDSSADDESTASDSGGDNESADATETESEHDDKSESDADAEGDTDTDTATTPETTEGTADEQSKSVETKEDANGEVTTDPDQHSPSDGVQENSSSEDSGSSEAAHHSSNGTGPDESDLCIIDGIGGNRAEALSEVGIETPAELATADIQTIAEADGVGKKRAQNYKSAVTARSDGGPGEDRDEDEGENEDDQ